MVMRKIIKAERKDKSTIVTLECTHQLAFGGHEFDGRILLPHDFVGKVYNCREQHCARLKT